MRKATKRIWREFSQATDGDLDLRYDWPRRLQNALLALSRMDPGWICWVEGNIPRKQKNIRQITRKIERQARVLACRNYGFSSGQWLSIVYSDTPFSERGLTPC
jgi:hypothetical protein